MDQWLTQNNSSFPYAYGVESNTRFTDYYHTKTNHPIIQQYKTRKNDNYKNNIFHPYNYINSLKQHNELVYQYIEPTTNGYAVDVMYRKLIDYCKDKNLKIMGNWVFNRHLKKDFQIFCFEISESNMVPFIPVCKNLPPNKGNKKTILYDISNNLSNNVSNNVSKKSKSWKNGL